ncbi:MAG TPA: methylmalonyl-CoA mutase family protein, partial [Dehalococcoidia bacterium]|nr:methylmalonyl-CoA mutase family protein [Dehalococcoidia bacterium]
AVRTQQIIAHESGLTDTIDPLAGSYFVENLTNELEARARALIDRIDDLGGAVAAIESGYMQQEVQEASVRWQNEVESGKRTIVGVNRFQTEEEPEVGIFRPNPEAADAQVRQLSSLRAERDGRAVDESLAALRTASGDDAQNLMEPIMRAVRAYATVGEICGVLREEWGEYSAPTAV